MSRDTIVAKRYARALFEVARELNQIEQIEEQLKSVLLAIRSNVDFGKLLEHPNLDASAKAGMLANVFGGKVSDAVLNTLKLLVDRGRETILGSLVDNYVNIANEALGQATAIVTTPGAITDDEMKEIASRFSQLTGKKIRVEHQIDAGLLGGLTVRIGDRLYDGSLSGKLSRLQKSLQTNQAIG